MRQPRVQHGVAYVCEKAAGPDRTCDFRSGKIILQRPIEPEQMQKLLTDRQDRSAAPLHFEERPPVLGVSRARRDGKVGFEFAPREAKAPKAKAAGPAKAPAKVKKAAAG